MNKIKATSKKAISWLLLAMLLLGAVSFQSMAVSAAATRSEQRALQGVLDADLQPENAQLPFETLQNSQPPPTANAAGPEAGPGLREAYAKALQAESERITSERFIVKYRDAGAVQQTGTAPDLQISMEITGLPLPE
jgi:hypothetical protein